VFIETASGTRADRPTLEQHLDQLRPAIPWSSGNSTGWADHSAIVVDTVTRLDSRGICGVVADNLLSGY
jgi:hypothetical protein